MTLDGALGIVMPFGKHKGLELSEVPAGYLLWLEEQDFLRGDMAEAVKLIVNNPNFDREREAGGE